MVCNVISSLKNKNAHVTTFPTSVLKYIAPIVSLPISVLISKSLSTGHFPDSMKVARIVPLKKPGDPTDMGNYRPISILPIISKVFEKVVHSQLYRYLNHKKILYANQYGFRPKTSTTQAIINHTQYLYDSIDAGNYIISIFLDFAKAFDTVDHNILLSKLHFYGIRGVAHACFQSYLFNGKQYTTVNGHTSVTSTITHGVPQGSIVGPLLFLIYINDLPNASFFRYTLYADDSTLSTAIDSKCVYSSAYHINKELSNINRWLSANKMAINPSKTHCILFSYKFL